eukprot:7310545-Karenia_brevis.AAC.1
MKILNRRLRYGVGGLEYEADPKHRDLVVGYFRFDASTRNLVENGDGENKEEESSEGIPLGGGEAKEF